MKLLKVGSLNIPRNRWNDSLDLFDGVIVACFSKEIENKKFYYKKFDEEKLLNKIILKLIYKLRHKASYEMIENMLLGILRIINKSYLKSIDNLEFDYVHSSYNYFDDSGIMTILLKNVINAKPVIRAYKETRNGYDYFEKKSLEIADVTIFNTVETKKLLESKYGKTIFDTKKVILGLDEDYRSKVVIDKERDIKKLSEKDHKPHVVILAGACTSDCSIKSLGSRQYYIPLIKEMIESGLVVHIHTLKIYKTSQGVDLYQELKKLYPEKLYIEPGLDFENHPDESYEILGRYDFGVLHNLNSNDDVSEFDQINISHRFYEYQIAKVAPIVKRGTTIVEENVIQNNKCGLVYDDLSDLLRCLNDNYTYFTPSFSDYINSVYIERL